MNSWGKGEKVGFKPNQRNPAKQHKKKKTCNTSKGNNQREKIPVVCVSQNTYQQEICHMDLVMELKTWGIPTSNPCGETSTGNPHINHTGSRQDQRGTLYLCKRHQVKISTFGFWYTVKKPKSTRNGGKRIVYREEEIKRLRKGQEVTA